MADEAAWEPRYTLKDAASKFWPDGSMTKRSLTRLINQRKLRAEKPNGRYYGREGAIVAMCEASATEKHKRAGTPHTEKSAPPPPPRGPPRHPALWVIRDGKKEVSTGASEHEIGRAQKAYADYCAD